MFKNLFFHVCWVLDYFFLTREASPILRPLSGVLGGPGDSGAPETPGFPHEKHTKVLHEPAI